MKNSFFFLLAIVLLGFGCDKDDPEPSTNVLRVKFKFDPNQERLDNLGNATPIPAGNAGQTPTFHGLSGHFIELLSNEFTPYKAGEELYSGPEVASSNSNPYGFTTAIDFEQAIIKNDGETFLEIPIVDIDPGTYRHLRISVSYQSYDVNFNLVNVPQIGDINGQSGRIASFLGFNQYVSSFTLRESDVTVNSSVLQGFWAFETDLSAPYESFNVVTSGQAPANATTVVNPFPNNPIPPGSCVVTGSMDQDLVITGTETEDLEITLSFSIDRSFEWEDTNGNGEWDLDASDPTSSESVVDMGLRGLQVQVGQ